VPPGKARLNEWGVFFRRSPQQAKTKKGYSRLMSPNRSQIHNDNGESPFVLVADHAGNLFPRALGHLGLSSAECRRHVTWEIGIGEPRASSSTATDRLIHQHRFLNKASLPRYPAILTKSQRAEVGVCEDGEEGTRSPNH
jgi:hypothetical protein